jgi:dehydrodolichyl diphosphate syntase complex subunit NUS1
MMNFNLYVALIISLNYFLLGILKHQLSRNFYDTIQKQLDVNSNENVVWGPDYHQTTGEIKFPHRNGYRRHIIINLYSSQDSYGSFNQLLTHDLRKTPSNQISIDLVDERLNKLFGNIPDPELAVYFGNSTCTSGFLPWHIRLTEFIQISYKLNYLSLDKYLRVLYKFARCEQRFGK